MVCDARGQYIPAPGRTRVPYSSKVNLRYPVCSDGQGSVRVRPGDSLEVVPQKELGFILEVHKDTKEVDLFTTGEHGYF